LLALQVANSLVYRRPVVSLCFQPRTKFAQPDTLPESAGEFLELTKIPGTNESLIVKLPILGWNALNLSAASDPILAFLNPEWDDDRKQGFRLAVRNYAANCDCEIGDAVGIIKPGFEKAFAKEKAAKEPVTA